MRNSAWFSILGLSLLFGQNGLRADISPPIVSSTLTDTSTPAVAMGWNPSPDTNVVGYYLAWGAASGQETNLIDVATVTNATVSGLTTNVTYYFTVIAYDALGDQAPPSNEIQYMATNAVSVVAPAIVSDLTNQTAMVGANVSLQIGVTGTAPFAFQWMLNGAPLPSATSNPLNLDNLTLAQAGAYQVVVTNTAGSVTSSIANIVVLSPPSITLDMTNQTVAAGANVWLAVGVSGSGPLAYQWLFNGTDLPGATANPLVLNNVSAQQAGSYQIVVSNAVGVVTSKVAVLTVLMPPTISANPSSQTVAVGSNATFQVGVAGSSPFSYQWQFNGNTLLGATADALALNNLSSEQAGGYQVIVANAVGSATSAVAVLSVLTPPSILVDLTNQSAAAGSSVSLSVGAVGSSPLSYQWTLDGTNVVGATTNPLVLANFGSAQAGTYQVLVTNAVGTALSSVANLTVLLPPTITADLTNETVLSGSSVTLTVGLSGTGPFSSQWFFNGTALAGANVNPLTLSSVTSSQAGTYQVVVANAQGAVTSRVATLSVLVPPSILVDLTNQTVLSGSPLSLEVQAAGTAPLIYQWLFNGTNLTGATDSSLLITNASFTQAGVYQLTVTNAVGFAQSASATITVLSPPTIVVDLTNQTVAAGSDVSFSLGVSGTPLNYQWFYNGVTMPGATTNPLVLPKVGTSSSGTYQAIVSNALGTVQSASATLTVLKRNWLQVKSKTSTSLSLTFAGVPAQTYTVQYSTNLSGPWQTIGTSTSDPSGMLLYYVNAIDPVAFYRVVSP